MKKSFCTFKLILTVLGFISINSLSYASTSFSSNESLKSMEKSEHNTDKKYKEIDAQELKKIIDFKENIIILDARAGSKWDNGKRIKGAKGLSVNATLEDMQKVIPTKDSKVIVYCGSHQCPMGRNLAENIVKNGYTNVYEYPGGIKEWESLGFPIEEIK